MKQLIALFFLSLLCLVTVPAERDTCRMSYLLAESSEAEWETKESKEEIKELITAVPKHLYLASTAACITLQHTTLFSPGPVLDKHTPPPDACC